MNSTYNDQAHRYSEAAVTVPHVTRLVLWLQMGKPDKPGALDDPTRPYIKFDIVAHLDTLSSHEVKRVSQHQQPLCTTPLQCLRHQLHAQGIEPILRLCALPHTFSSLLALTASEAQKGMYERRP